MVRIIRMGRMYKLIKLTKLFRILKVVKGKKKLSSAMKDYFKVSAGLERLIFGLVSFIITIHIVSCLWIFFGYFDFIGSWLDSQTID